MFVTRFAPSPTGRLHLGHAFSALCAYDASQRAKGRFILRIEDIDAVRCRGEYEVGIFEDLAWLGIGWEEPVWRQSTRMAAYQTALETLIKRGLMYRCFKTRKALAGDSANAPHSQSVAYSGAPLPETEENRLLAENRPYAWRLSVRACQSFLGNKWHLMSCQADGATMPVQPEILGDVILARKDVPSSYHLASVVDDAAQGITHIIRGVDLIPAIHVHVLLQTLLCLPTPNYTHHRLIHDEQGVRLAKRDQAITLAALRAAGVSLEQIRTQLGLQA